MSSGNDVRGVTPSLKALQDNQIYNSRAKGKKATGVRNKTENSVDRFNMDMKDVYKSLTVLGNEIVNKLDELLKGSLPEGGLRALKPEDHTAEATAQRIADGSLALFSVYQKQNPRLEGEELLNSFMQTIRGGIKQGYDDAAGILEGLGAFKFDGVKDGISKTMTLVEAKLQAFEATYRESLKKQAAAQSSAAPAEPKVPEQTQ